MRISRFIVIVGALIGLALIVTLCVPALRARVARLIRPRVTIARQLDRYGPGARSRLAPAFGSAGIAYPPGLVALLVFKSERRMDAYAAERGAASGDWKFISAYPILAASGQLGPKLREGDRQVPEGVYGIESLNPNSLYHLSLRVGYPNEFDRLRGAEDGRTQLGGDIMIHGGAASIGCLAMGDPVAEELFVLAADVGIEHVQVIICPEDWRSGVEGEVPGQPAWVTGLYEQLRARLKEFPAKERAARQ